MVVHQHVDGSVGAGADGDAGLKIGGVHVDDAGVGVAEVVHQGGVRLGGDDGQGLAVGLHAHDLGVAGGAVMVLQQVLKALLDGGGIHVAAGGELHAVAQRDGPGVVAVIFPGGGQPGLQLHVVGVVHQGLAHAVADAGPAVVGAVRVDSLFPVFRVEGGIADDHSLLCSSGRGRALRFAFRSRSGCRGAVASATAGQQANCQTQCEDDGKGSFHVFLSSKHIAYFRKIRYTGDGRGGFSAARQFPQAASLLLSDGSQVSRFLAFWITYRPRG